MNVSTPAVSIVIPVHNCGNMLLPCLQSIRAQSFESFEVIIVNNGSDDGSAEAARAFAETDQRFRVVDNLEGGAGASRNFGVARAAGDYVCFIDGDDRISEDYLEGLYNGARDNDADIAVCGFDFYFLNSGKTKKGMRVPDRVYSRDEALGLLLGDTKMRFYLWEKLFRRTLFTEHGISIPDMYYEDAVASVKLFYFANKVSSISYCGYYYTRAFSRYKEVNMTAKRANDYINTVPLIRLFLEEHGCYDKFRSSFNNHIFHVYFAVPSVVKQSSAGNKKPDRENIKRAKAKVRLCCKVSFEKLGKLDLSKPVIE